MPANNVRCPRCHEAATEIRALLFQQSVAYCGHCGWNIDKATAKLRTDMWAVWLFSGLGAIMAATAWVRGPYGVRGALLIAIPFIALPVGSGLFTWYRLSHVFVTSAEVNQQALKDSVPLVAPEDVAAISLAVRPRVVRLTMRGYAYSAGMALVTAVVLWLMSLGLQGIARGTNAERAKGTFVLAGWSVALWTCISFFRNRIRERRLFINGEITRGIVLNQSETRTGRRIVYAYSNSNGANFQNCATDFSNQLYDEMPIHVFYDPIESSASAALEGSLYKIRGQ